MLFRIRRRAWGSLNDHVIKKAHELRLSWLYRSGLEIAPERDSEVSWSNDVGAISSPDLVEVLRVLVGNSALIRQVVHEDLGSPILHLDTKNRIGHGVIALSESWTSEPIVQLIQ